MDLHKRLDELMLQWARSEFERKFHAANSSRLKTEITEVNRLIHAARSAAPKPESGA